MNDREFENYLALLSGMLRLRRTQQSDIAGELRDHLIEHVSELERRGVPHEQAVRNALQEFGDAAALAASFSALVRTRRRRLIMRCTIGTSLVLAGLMIGVFAFRPPVENDSIVAQAQQGPGPGQPAVRGNPLQDIPSEPNDPRDDTTRGHLIKVVDADFTELPLREALQYLGDQLKIQFYVDRRSLEAEGVAEDIPVTFNLRKVPGEMILDLMLREKGLAYTLRSGVVIVGSKSDIQSQTEVRVYPVTSGAEELAQLIPATIEPHTWRYISAPVLNAYGRGAPSYPAAGGPPGAVEEAGGAGSIRVFQGVLVVSQTPDVHRKIEKLISDLNSVLRRRGGTTSSGPHPPAYLDPTRTTGPAPTTVIESRPLEIPPQAPPLDGSGPVERNGAPRDDGGPGVPTKASPGRDGGNSAPTKLPPETK